MTGAPAETWRKFTFSKSPPWAFWVGGVLLRAALAEHTSGYLPLTRASVNRIRTVTWIFGGLIPLAFAFFVVGVLVDGSLTLFFLLVGIGSLFAGLIGVLIGRSAVSPSAIIYDRQPGYYESLLELRNVHPSFVAAVQQHQQMRAQQAPRQ